MYEDEDDVVVDDEELRVFIFSFFSTDFGLKLKYFNDQNSLFEKKNDYLLDPSVLIVLQSRMISTEDSLFALSVFRKKVR